MNVLDRIRPTPGLEVLITAGASGIDAASSDAFMAADANFCDIDRGSVEGIRARRPGSHATVADIAAAAEADRSVNGAENALGGPDVLVNNGGFAGPTGRVEDLTAVDWQRTITTHLNSQFHFLRRAVRLLKASPTPGIIVMSSVAKRVGSSFRTDCYATKYAIIGLIEVARDRARAG